jgi:gliding motility-associated-like protein
MAQMTVTTGQTAQQLAEIIAGAGVTVSNASVTGSAQAIGDFNTGANPTGLNVGSGVVFGTGNVTDYSQNQTTFASTNLGEPGNPYLANLATIDSYDALTLEFDFVPNADFVSFDYVFGSEEHPTFSCDPFFNDIFAITVEGVSVPLAETLITLVPGTTTPVSIGTINNQGCGNPAYFVDNAAMNGQYVAFGGFTTVLTAEMAVICGETYHLRMMISDGGDGTFDSGCFVAENSLTTGNVTIEAASLGGDTAAIEGCGDLEITLTLNGDPIAQDYPVSIWLSDASTAEWGVDYDPITVLNLTDSTIIIPAGSSSVSFIISAVNDNIPEGIETIDLIAITSTCGSIDTFSLYILDLDPLQVSMSNDTTICQGNAIGMATASSGGGGFIYTWDQGIGVANPITPTPTVTTTYTVTVTDGCSSTPVQDSIVVTVDGGPVPFAGNDVSVCIGGSVLLNASSNALGSTFSWVPATDLSATNLNNPLSTPQMDIEYIVTVTRPDGCSNDDTVLVTLTPPPTADFNLPTVGCAGTPLLVNYTGNANAAAQYQWNFDGGIVTNGSGIGPLAVYWETPGIYTVDLTVAWNGCVSTNETNPIEIFGPPTLDAGSDISFCSGDSGSIGSGPLAGVNYTWTPINGVADPSASLTSVELINPTHDTQVIDYVLRAEEQGCKSWDTVSVTVFATPTAEFTIPDGKCFPVNNFDLLAAGYFGDSATFAWNFGSVGFPTSSTVQNPQGQIFNAPGAQSVSIVITDNTCVSDTFVGEIDVYAMPVADFSSDVVDGCEPLTVVFEDQSVHSSNSLYRIWSLGDGGSATQSDPGHTYEAGVYSVNLSVVTGEGCADDITKNAYIKSYHKPTSLFSMDEQVLDILDPTVTVTNLTDSAVSSEFTFNEPYGDQITAMQTNYEYPDTGVYSITQIVTTANGCLDTISGTLEVKPHYTFYIPNAFTPDDNAKNETWIPQGESVLDFNMIIYNRWNQELFFSASLNNGWDGSFKGKNVQQGVYTYKIETVDILGVPHKYFGTFLLLR